MTILRTCVLRLRGLVGKKRLDRELADELDGHVQSHIDDNLRAGMTPEHARRDALITLGGVQIMKEEYRRQASLAYLVDTFVGDLRYALRALRRRPGFAAGAVAALAVGMGVTTVGFSAINGIFLKGPAGRSAPGAGWIFLGGARDTARGASFADYEDLARRVPALAEVAAETRGPLAWQTADGPETLWALTVSRNYLRLLDAHPLAGRLFANRAAGEGPSAIVSERFWRDRLGGAPLAGLTLRLNHVDVPVTGILPKSFRGPGGFYDPSVWVPLDEWQALGLPPRLQNDAERPLSLFGWLAAGTARPHVEAALNVWAAERRRARGSVATVTPSFVPFSDGNPELQRIFGLAYLPMGMLAGVLLIAMINVSGLLFARAVDRQREFSLRTSLGASRSRLVRQLVTEQFVLAALGGAAALLVSFWSAALLRAFALPSPTPQHVDLAPDRTLLVFVAALVILSTIVPALGPAWQTTGDRLMRGIQGGFLPMARPLSARGLIVLVQVAGATLLLAGTALFFGNVRRIQAASLGFERERAIVVEIVPAAHGYDAAGARLLVDRVIERIRALPGVADASMADRLPFALGRPRTVGVSATSTPCGESDCAAVPTDQVAPRYFRTLGIPVLRGREFDDSAGDAEAAVVSQAMAERFWPGEDPVGRRILAGLDGRTRRVIGVAADTLHYLALGERPLPYLYLPLDTVSFAERIAIVARTGGPPDVLVRTVRDQIGLVDSQLPVLSVKTMEQHLKGRLWLPQAAAQLAGVCGVLSLVLAAVGLFGVISQIVGQRTREFGIRLAIGASPRDLGALVFRESAILSLPGVALGLAGGTALSRVLAAVMTGLTGMSLAAYALVASFEVTVIVLVCLMPARRAASINPMTALRAE